MTQINETLRAAIERPLKAEIAELQGKLDANRLANKIFRDALNEAHTALHLVLINRNHYTLNSQTEKAVLEAHKLASDVLYPELKGDD